MKTFIDDHRDVYVVEPICRVLPIAPSTYCEHAAREADPGRMPARKRRDAELAREIRRVFTENFGVYGGIPRVRFAARGQAWAGACRARFERTSFSMLWNRHATSVSLPPAAGSFIIRTADRRGWHRTFRRQRRGQLRQRPRRNGDRPLQDGGDPLARTLAILRGHRIRHSRMGRRFNNCRLLEPIGNIPPAEAEAAYYRPA